MGSTYNSIWPWYNSQFSTAVSLCIDATETCLFAFALLASMLTAAVLEHPSKAANRRKIKLKESNAKSNVVI
jgi:hypothetical protein